MFLGILDLILPFLNIMKRSSTVFSRKKRLDRDPPWHLAHSNLMHSPLLSSSRTRLCSLASPVASAFSQTRLLPTPSALSSLCSSPTAHAFSWHHAITHHMPPFSSWMPPATNLLLIALVACGLPSFWAVAVRARFLGRQSATCRPSGSTALDLGACCLSSAAPL